MDHLIAVEVLCPPPLAIASVTGYREIHEPIFENGLPVFGPDGEQLVRTFTRANTVDVEQGGTAYLDPAETRIDLLVQCGIVRVLPKAKGGAVKNTPKVGG